MDMKDRFSILSMKWETIPRNPFSLDSQGRLNFPEHSGAPPSMLNSPVTP